MNISVRDTFEAGLDETTPTAESIEDASMEKNPSTDDTYKNSQYKCPKCGATDISHNEKTGHLVCNYCRHSFMLESVGSKNTEEELRNIEGESVQAGAAAINPEADNLLTLKCTSCGAEIVLDTSEAYSARCHWCRNTLSINEQIPNGNVPDAVLPFAVPKDRAQDLIKGFVKKRKFFALPRFKKEFTTENIMGVYFPYMIIDVNSSAHYEGMGEELVREYTVSRGDDKEKRYDANLYWVERDFDMVIDDLTVESNTDKMDMATEEKTNNIINTILPFDTENCVRWNANYLKGYSSEKRDVNVEELKPLVQTQAKDIARFAANETLTQYDRGVKWAREDYTIKGMRWMSAYLPVWLYSYQQKKRGGEGVLHYVAVNARTEETMGSIPINKPKLFIVSAIIQLIASIIGILLSLPFIFSIDSEGTELGFLFFLAGFAFYWAMYSHYRNANERHHHEKETRFITRNVKKVDKFMRELKGLKSSEMEGANNSDVHGSLVKEKKFLDFKK